ncbi:hypothetical protein ACFO4E_08075 [Nocardiopsis mangrovi]|uniref:Uncharacterized protein n=1 Tax=Nocardiopsis mangrovi TaxID=1179818 RepID=A0ABV9DSV9_9ACTN
MALVKKGARRIVVDGAAYRWRLRSRPTYCQAMAWGRCTYAVEGADAPGAVLVVTTAGPRMDGIARRDRAAVPVLPSDVARAIRAALVGGWTPWEAGPPFRLDLEAGAAAPVG